MAVKKTFVVFFLVILIFSFTFSVFASSVPDFSDALVYTEDSIALGEAFVSPPVYFPVDGQFYRLYSRLTDSGVVIVDVVVQCVDGDVVDPVSGCAYFAFEDVGEEYGIFYFPMYEDDTVEAQSALFAASAPDVPVDNSITAGLYSVLGILGIILRSFGPSGPLFPLMVLLVLGISVSFLIYSVYVIRKFVWGD